MLANFMCQPATEYLDLNIFFLSVSVEDFLNEISIWLGGLGRVDPPVQSGWAASNPLTIKYN